MKKIVREFLQDDVKALAKAIKKFIPSGGAVTSVSADLTSVKALIAANSAQLTSANNAISQAVSVLSANVAVNSTQMVSANNAISNAVSVVSAAVLSVNQIVSVLSADHLSLKDRVSANSALISNNASAIAANSAQMISADNTISNAVSIVSVAVATLSADVTSVKNIISVHSQAISVLSQQVSALSQNLSANSVVLSNTRSAVTANSAQMTSADNAISNAVSILSAQLSLQVSALSQAVSAISVRVDTISTGLGGVQMRVISSGNQVLSNTGSAVISGLSISAAINGIYEVHAMIPYTMTSATTSTIGFGLTFPGMKAGTAGLWRGDLTVGQAAQTSALGSFNEDGSGSIHMSATIVAAPNSTLVAMMDGIFLVSTAGTIQVTGRTGGVITIFAGGFIRAFKIG